MATRSTTEVATFAKPFKLAGYPDELPSGCYDVVIEEDILEGLSFLAYRRIGTYLTIRGRGAASGHVEVRSIAEADLSEARISQRQTVG